MGPSMSNPGNSRDSEAFGSKGWLLPKITDALVDAPVFRFDEMEIAFDPWKLLRGKFEVSSILLR